jgi:hypothetical protein
MPFIPAFAQLEPALIAIISEPQHSVAWEVWSPCYWAQVWLCHTERVTESKAPALLKDNYEVAGGGVVACSVLNGILRDGLSGKEGPEDGMHLASRRAQLRIAAPAVSRC